MDSLKKDVEVRSFYLPDHEQEVPLCRTLLCGEELERAGKFIRPSDHDSFVLCRGLLRRILAGFLDEDPVSLRFGRSIHGKPFLENGAMEFNVSHSRDRLLVAVTSDGNVGVDIEFRRDGLNLSAIAERWFSPEEWSFFHSAERPEKCFFEIWAKKEAYVKALGAGIYKNLNTFTVPLGTDPFRPAASSDGKWFFQTLEIDPGYAAAVVSEAPARTVHVKSGIV